MTDIAVREAREADAQPILQYLLELTSEPAVPILTTHEQARSWTEAYESEFIRQHREARNSILLLALAGERIVGTLDMSGGDRPETAHSTTLGMSVAQDWRDRGVGRALLTRALGWARETGSVSRVELEVFPHNARAIHLYKRMGFRVEGRRRQAYVKDGVALDSVVMGLLL